MVRRHWLVQPLHFAMVVVKLQMIDLVDGEHGGLYTVLITLTGDQCSTESTHDTGDIRADCFTSGNLFETAKNGIVVERTAPHNDVFAKLRSIGNFDYFIKSILITE